MTARTNRREPFWLRRWWDAARTGYWFVPLVCVVAAVTLAFVLIGLDRYLQDTGNAAWTYAGGPENASDTLTTIASSMITFTGLVFSITVVALQLTSSQFSPRALRTFLRDPVSQWALGVFVATFAYSFTALSVVRVAADDDEAFVPAITVTGAFALIAASIAMFVHFIHHTAQSLRVVNIIERIAEETRACIDAVYPPADDDPEPPPALPTQATGSLHVVPSPKAGVITDIDVDGLAEVADRHHTVVELLAPVGDYVCRGEPIMRWRSPDMAPDGEDADGLDLADDDDWHRHVGIEPERTMRADPGFGLRQLVDIAERALSPGVNDPTTAIQCLDRIHDLLRVLTARPIPDVILGAHDGLVRAWAPSPSYEDLLDLGLTEITAAAEGSPRVLRRVERVLDDLESITDDPRRRAAIAEQRRRLAETAQLRVAAPSRRARQTATSRPV